jgi:hypothetical protein
MVTELVEVLKLGLSVEVGVLNPFIYEKIYPLITFPTAFEEI